MRILQKFLWGIPHPEMTAIHKTAPKGGVPDFFKHPSCVVRPWDLPTDHGTRWVGDKERAVLVMGCGEGQGDGREGGEGPTPARNICRLGLSRQRARQPHRRVCSLPQYAYTVHVL